MVGGGWVFGGVRSVGRSVECVRLPTCNRARAHIPRGRRRLEAHADGVFPVLLVADGRGADADDVEVHTRAVEELFCDAACVWCGCLGLWVWWDGATDAFRT